MCCAGCHENAMLPRLVYQFNKHKTQPNPKLYRSTIRESIDSPNQDSTHLTDNAAFLLAGLPMRLQSSIFADTSHCRAWTRRGNFSRGFDWPETQEERLWPSMQRARNSCCPTPTRQSEKRLRRTTTCLRTATCPSEMSLRIPLTRSHSISTTSVSQGRFQDHVFFNSCCICSGPPP